MNMKLSFPAAHRQAVTQAHADYCAAHGHATWTVGGKDNGVCPRCGEVKVTADTVSSELVEKFDRMIHLAGRIKDLQFSKAWARADHLWVGYDKALKADRAEQNALWDSLTLDELTAFGEYRKAH